MKFEVRKENNNVIVNVTLVGRKRDDKMQSCDTAKVLSWLRENHPQYNISTTVTAPKKELHNSLGPGRLSGEWIFELVTKKQKTSTPAQVEPVLTTEEVTLPVEELVEDKLNIINDNTTTITSVKEKSTKKRKTYTRRAKKH